MVSPLLQQIFMNKQTAANNFYCFFAALNKSFSNFEKNIKELKQWTTGGSTKRIGSHRSAFENTDSYTMGTNIQVRLEIGSKLQYI